MINQNLPEITMVERSFNEDAGMQPITVQTLQTDRALGHGKLYILVTVVL